MFGTHVVTGDSQDADHGFAVGTRVELELDDGSTWKRWADQSGKSYWVADEDLQPVEVYV